MRAIDQPIINQQEAIDENPVVEQQYQFLSQEQVLSNIFEDDAHRRELPVLYQLQEKMDKWGRETLKLMNINREGWHKNDRYKYNKFILRPVREKWEKSAKKYHDKLYSLPAYLRDKVIQDRKKVQLNF